MTTGTEQGDTAAVTGKRVLVVDDDPILQEVMAEELTNAGFEVVRAENGEVACNLTGREVFNLAVIDISMPKLDGFGLLRHIRQHPRSVDLPVIVATSFNDKRSIEKAYELGASSFVTKPINWPQFAHHARFVMRNGEIERALRAAEAESSAASKMKNGMFQVLSHELKTPLSALIGLTNVVSASLSGKVDGMEAENLQHVVEAAHRLNGIVSDILLLSKALAGPTRQQLVNCPLRDIVDDGIVGLKSKAREANVNLVIRLPAPDLMTFCDPQLMRQAMFKLVDNAIKFSPPGGTVEIWGHGKDDGSTIISVRDHGPGLSQVKLKECLQPFIQDDMSYGRQANGLGLGLPIAKSIVEAHGGEMIFDTTLGQGLLAAIWIPPRRALPEPLALSA